MKKIIPLIILVLSFSAQAQELTPDDSPLQIEEPVLDIPENDLDIPDITTITETEASEPENNTPTLTDSYTGTLAEDDPDNQTETTDTEDETSETEDETQNPTHTVTFEFTGHVQFIRMSLVPNDYFVSDAPYLEIEYVTKWEKEVDLALGRSSFTADAEFEEDHWGFLAENEFSSCRLEIDKEGKLPFKTSLKLKKPKTDSEGNEIEPAALGIKVDLSKDDFYEGWYSYCSGQGSELNTKGEDENYNFRVLNLIQPDMTSLSIENVDMEKTNRIELTVEAQTIEDYEIDSLLNLYGNGSITIEPVQ